ncbi:MAG: hypothetical protein ABL902_06875 [Gallionella sp.]
MKKGFTLLVIATTTWLLSGCSFDNGSSAAPPTNLSATAGEGKVKVTWTASSGVEYWLFSATSAALSAFNWTSLPNAQVAIKASSPFYLCGLPNGVPFYFAANGRVNGGPGGASSATVSGTPRFAGAVGTWVSSATATNNLFGVGYVSLTTCSNPTISAAGSFATVGANGAIFTSQTTDGLTPITWTSRSVTGGFSTNLNAVAGYAANQNNPTSPGLRWVAVGEGGATVISTDGITWSAGTSYNPTNQALRSIIQVGGTFLAVGDAGTILSSTDGITWTARTSTTTSNLRGISYGNGVYVAVGDSGTIRTSVDGITWAAPTSSPTLTDTLRQASSVLTTLIAVGDNGTILTSTDQGRNWSQQNTSALGTPNFVGIASNGVAYASSTAGIIPVLQFLALDNNGNYYTSSDGISWTTAAVSTGVSSLNTLVSSGFGYVAVGNAGAAVSAF